MAEALRHAVGRLEAAGVEGAAGDARRLLAHAMGVAADRLTLHLGDVLGREAAARLEDAVAAREARQPVAQIVGERLFWGRRFTVTRDVLDPRPETETLVAAALAGPFQRVLDLGVGSGAILISLLADREGASGVGTDVSSAALAVAQGNAVAHGVAWRAEFVEADWFRGVTGTFDLIVSNPPYIAEAEIAGLAPEVRDWEPHLALSPGGDGLNAYRAIVRGVVQHLAPGGRVHLEIGPSQGQAVVALLRQADLAEIRILADLDGRDRVVSAWNP